MYAPVCICVYLHVCVCIHISRAGALSSSSSCASAAAREASDGSWTGSRNQCLFRVPIQSGNQFFFGTGARFSPTSLGGGWYRATFPSSIGSSLFFCKFSAFVNFLARFATYSDLFGARGRILVRFDVLGCMWSFPRTFLIFVHSFVILAVSRSVVC